MVACPYHTRSFNWWTPEWPEGMKTTLNPDVSIRTRGVVEKCNFCVQRLQAARAKASAAGQTEIDPADYVPACVEACPSRALSFGDAADEKGEVAAARERPRELPAPRRARHRARRSSTAPRTPPSASACPARG